MNTSISRILGEDAQPTTADCLRAYLMLFRAYLANGFAGKVRITDHAESSDDANGQHTFTDVASFESYIDQVELDQYTDVLTIDPEQSVRVVIDLYCPGTDNFKKAEKRFFDVSIPFIYKRGRHASRLEAPLLGTPRGVLGKYAFVHTSTLGYPSGGYFTRGCGAVYLHASHNFFTIFLR